MPLPLAPNGRVIITGYYPNISLSVVGIVVFGLLALAYFFRFFRSGRPYPQYMLWVTIGALTMALGFVVRIPMHNDPTSIPIYTVSTLLILLSPCAFIAQDYYILPHLAAWLGANQCLFLRPKLIKSIFITSDVITFLIQLGGSGMSASASLASTGEKIALAGLIAQLISFGIFISLLIWFGIRVRRRHPELWHDQDQRGWKSDWRVMYFVLCWTTIGTMIRCVFRVIEFSQGYDGVLRTTEFWFYVLDSLPLALAIAPWAIVWPPSYLKGKCHPLSHSIPLSEQHPSPGK